MANRNNDVYAMLVSSGNQVLAATGTNLDALLPGQIGVYDADTHEVPAADAPPKRFYIAVGIDRTGSGTLEDYRHSAGQYIPRTLVNGYGFRAHTASQPQIVEISGIAARCDRDYTIRVEYRNARIENIQGANQFSQAFSVRGACCPDCGDDDCSQADANDVAIKLFNEINLNSMGRLTATIFAGQGNIQITTEPTSDGDVTVTLGDSDPITVALLNADTEAVANGKIAAAINAVEGTPYNAVATATSVLISGPAGSVAFSGGTTGTVATTSAIVAANVTDPVDFIADNPNAVLTLRLTPAALPATSSSSINLHYYKLRQTSIIVSLVEGFDCSGVVTEIQPLVYEEGNGSDIREVEYDASAWAGSGPYVASELLGLAKENVEYLAVAATKYDKFTLEYTMKHGAGFGNAVFENTFATYIAIPEADTVTRNAFATLMDAILEGLGFDALADDVLTASTNPAVVEADAANEDVDGLA